MSSDSDWLGPIWTLAALPILIMIVRNHAEQYIISLFLSFRKRSKKLALQRQLNEFKKELTQISQVDEFAKHSRLVRKMRATKDELSAIRTEEMSINVKYVLAIQGIAWLTIVLLAFRLVYQIYSLLMNSWLDWIMFKTPA